MYEAFFAQIVSVRLHISSPTNLREMYWGLRIDSFPEILISVSTEDWWILKLLKYSPTDKRDQGETNFNVIRNL
jgi:hypothetical protein